MQNAIDLRNYLVTPESARIELERAALAFAPKINVEATAKSLTPWADIDSFIDAA